MINLDALLSAIQPGDRVQCRTARDDWWETTALSGVRYTRVSPRSPAYPVIAVGPWGDLPAVNWPAEDVRLAHAYAIPTEDET